MLLGLRAFRVTPSWPMKTGINKCAKLEISVQRSSENVDPWLLLLEHISAKASEVVKAPVEAVGVMDVLT